MRTNRLAYSKISEFDSEFPRAGSTIDGRNILSGPVPNTSSISASLLDYRVLPGIREVSMSYFSGPKSVFYAVDDFQKSEKLAKEIEVSKTITPLIIVIDKDGPYILEGAHRYVALFYLGAKSFPALVVLDDESIEDDSQKTTKAWTVSNCRFAQTIAFNKELLDRVIQKHLGYHKDALQEELELGATPLDANKYRTIGEQSLTSIQEPLRSKLNQKLQEIVSKYSTGNIEEARKDIEETIASIISPAFQKEHGFDWVIIRNFYKMLVGFDDHIMAVSQKQEPLEQQLEVYKAELLKEYNMALQQAQSVLAILESFAATTDKQVKFVLEPNFSTTYLSNVEIIYPLNFSVDVMFSGEREAEPPSFTLFAKNDEKENFTGKYDVDDILEWGDSDFFINNEERNFYFNLIDYIRTGKLPKDRGTKFITLYRGMSSEEYNKWLAGEVIPAGKFFTTKPTSQMAMDISGEIPELYRVRARDDIVSQTSEDVYQTNVETKMIGNKLVPLNSSQAWVRANCRFAQQKTFEFYKPYEYVPTTNLEQMREYEEQIEMEKERHELLQQKLDTKEKKIQEEFERQKAQGKENWGLYKELESPEFEDLEYPPSDDYVFHGTTKEALSTIITQGLQPSVGDFVKDSYDEEGVDLEEILYLAGRDEIRSALNAIVYQVGKIKKYPWAYDSVTQRDIVEHGALIFVKKDSGMYKADEDQTSTEIIGDEEIKSPPMGVEPGDVWTKEPQSPSMVITGPQLVQVFNDYAPDLISKKDKSYFTAWVRANCRFAQIEAKKNYSCEIFSSVGSAMKGETSAISPEKAQTNMWWRYTEGKPYEINDLKGRGYYCVCKEIKAPKQEQKTQQGILFPMYLDPFKR